ncbi:nucleotidyltransferase domain-containing protein [Bdellovibrionota bacterium FG-1]
MFGSRARGDHHERSDFDLAVEAPDIGDEAWARFALELREKAPTLSFVSDPRAP